jgi:hypothetical protein
MLGLEPVADHVIVDPAVPIPIGRIELLDIPGRWGRIDAFSRGMVDLGGQPKVPQPATAGPRTARRRAALRR